MHTPIRSIDGAALALETTDSIHCSDSFPLGMLSVSHRIPDHILQEDFENTWLDYDFTVVNTSDCTNNFKTGVGILLVSS